MLTCILCGFSSGIPYFISAQMLPAWLKDGGVSIEEIGLFSLTTLPYALKFLWAPILDFFIPPFLGRRCGWAIIFQIALLFLIATMGLFSPTQDLKSIAIMTIFLSFFSASQDITLDAHRRELLEDNELGLGNSYFVNAYRLAGLVPGSLALILADQMSWSMVHLVVASFMLIGIGCSIWMEEPSVDFEQPQPHHHNWLQNFILPIQDFFSTHTKKQAILILIFLMLYKLGDQMATALATPFYLDMGFSKTQIGTVAKVASLWSSILGGFIGGIIMLKIGIHRALWIFGSVQVVSILGFAALSQIGNDITWLFWVVSFEYLGMGLGTAAFVAFIAKSTSKQYSGTQIALLTGVMGLARSIATAASGFVAAHLGYTSFFLVCTLLALPGMLMLVYVAPWFSSKSKVLPIEDSPRSHQP
ncbi:MAG: AmpG family muropeptide MFS transporter [Proteobacteria bacterium]|nr:AmpG family muropeptide MFS transporter [Pseudomonadota bacterium]